MTYELTFEKRPEYLYVKVSGLNTPDAVSEYMRGVLAECKRQDCFRVLIDEQLEGPRLSVDDVFLIASEGAMAALGVFEAVAYVDAQMNDLSYFAETVAVNRGMPVRAFSSVAEAEKWLLEIAAGGDEQVIFYSSGKPQGNET